MDGFNFVKFRIVAIQNWFDVSEAWIDIVESDEWEISVNPTTLDFGTIETVVASVRRFTITNTVWSF